MSIVEQEIIAAGFWRALQVALPEGYRAAVRWKPEPLAQRALFEFIVRRDRCTTHRYVYADEAFSAGGQFPSLWIPWFAALAVEDLRAAEDAQ